MTCCVSVLGRSRGSRAHTAGSSDSRDRWRTQTPCWKKRWMTLTLVSTCTNKSGHKSKHAKVKSAAQNFVSSLDVNTVNEAAMLSITQQLQLCLYLILVSCYSTLAAQRYSIHLLSTCCFQHVAHSACSDWTVQNGVAQQGDKAGPVWCLWPRHPCPHLRVPSAPSKCGCEGSWLGVGWPATLREAPAAQFLEVGLETGRTEKQCLMAPALLQMG